MTEMTYEKAIEIGGNEWKGGENHRVYFNDASVKAALYGVEIKGKDGYKDGEKISRNNLYKITSSKPYFDVNTKELKGLVKNFAYSTSYASL